MGETFKIYSLENQVALVTGAAGGMGFAISKQLAALGAKVILTDINETVVQKNAQEIQNLGYKAEALKLNILDLGNIEEVVNYVKETYGTLNILVNNAGAANDGLAINTSNEEWHKMIAINLDGAFYMSREFGKLMLEAKKGTVISVSSIAGFKVVRPEHHIGYDVAKAGIAQMTKVLASEWASANIRVNAVSPGYTNTAILQNVGANSPETIELWKSQIPQNRLLEPEEVANVVGFLASEAAGAMTGQTVHVDGGYNIW